MGWANLIIQSLRAEQGDLQTELRVQRSNEHSSMNPDLGWRSGKTSLRRWPLDGGLNKEQESVRWEWKSEGAAHTEGLRQFICEASRGEPSRGCDAIGFHLMCDGNRLASILGARAGEAQPGCRPRLSALQWQDSPVRPSAISQSPEESSVGSRNSGDTY